jgi:aryl-alcohol dehydrogenase-like predicted oxidoreductase
VSNHGVQQMQDILPTKTILSVNEMPYNLFCRAIETSIVPFCHNNRIGIIGYMALLQGVLSGKYAKAEDVPPPQAHSRHFKHERGREFSRHNEAGVEKELFAILSRMREIASSQQISVSQLAIAWTIANSDIACNLVGSRNLTQLQENLPCGEITLSSSIKSELDQLTHPILEKMGPNNPDYYEHSNHSRIR